MNVLGRLWRRLVLLVQRRRFERELEEEIQFHLDMQAERNQEAGMDPEEARFAAHREFGNAFRLRERCRDLWALSQLESLVQDARIGLRLLFKNPFSNLAIIITMALLSGVVSVVYASLRSEQRRLEPFPDASRLVKVWRTGPGRAIESHPMSLYRSFQSRTTSFRHLGAYVQDGPVTLTGHGEPRRCVVYRANARFFQALGSSLALGRLFSDDELTPGGAHVALVSHQLWTETLGGDENAMGARVILDDTPYTVIGVTVPEMRNTRLGFSADIWMPWRGSAAPNHAQPSGAMVGRLKDGVDRAQANAEVNALAAALEKAHAPSEFEKRAYPGGFSSAQLTPLKEQLRFDNRQPRWEKVGMWVFATCLVSSVALIACFNMTNILLSRVSSRGRETAIRLSIGASRARIARQWLTECLMLSLCGGALGLAAAVWMLRGLETMRVEARFDPWLCAAAFSVSAALGALVGLAPALRAARADLSRALKDGGPSSPSPSRHRLRNGLVASQVGMCMLLTVSAGLLTRSFLQMQRVDLGFDPTRMMAIEIGLRSDRYPKGADRFAFAERGLQALKAHPAVDRAALSFSGFLSHWAMRYETTLAPGRQPERVVPARGWRVSPGLLDMTGIRLIRGSGLSRDPTAAEAVINQSFADAHYPDENPIGQSLRIGRRSEKWLTVTGVVRDRSPMTGRFEMGPEVYTSYRHADYSPRLTYLIQTKGAPETAAESIREEIRKLDRSQPVGAAEMAAALIRDRMKGPRNTAILFGALAGSGLLISLLGVYGVVSYSAAERTREIGIRMALGARRGAVLWLTARQGARLLAFGALPGLLAALGISHGLPPGLLHGVGPRDPLTYGIVIATVGAAGVLALIAPALKATRLRPMDALRHE